MIYGAILVFGTVLFFVLPRPQQPLITLVHKELPTPAIGFSSDIELGSFSKVAKDYTVVFRAKLSEKPAELYWRGNTLELFKGGIWLPYGGSYASYRPLPNAPKVQEEILLSPYGDRIVFSYLYPVKVINSSERVFIDRTRGVVKAYKPFTDPVKVKLETTGRVYAVLKDKELLLRVPRELKPLLGKIVEEYHLKSPYLSSTLKRLSRYFSTFRYSETNRARNIVEFLTLYKEGNCEYFATAAALLLRYMGYPTRVVVGFYGGDYNPLTGYYVVRQKDAHAWVEIYSNHRWIRYDATKFASLAPSIKEELQPRLEKNRLLLFWDTLNTLWMEYVINLSAAKQAELAKKLYSSFKEVERGLSPKWFLLLILSLGVILLFLYKLRLRFLYGIKNPRGETLGEIYNFLWKEYPQVWLREKALLKRFLNKTHTIKT